MIQFAEFVSDLRAYDITQQNNWHLIQEVTKPNRIREMSQQRHERETNAITPPDHTTTIFAVSIKLSNNSDCTIANYSVA